MGKEKKTQTLPRATYGIGFVAPRYSAAARRFMTIVGGAYMRLFEGVRSVGIMHEEILIQELQKFYDGEGRLILAFRHVAKEDAPVMMYALSKRLNRSIRKLNRSRKKGEKIIPHARFLYGRDVLNWAGRAAVWLFPRIGCVPVQNRWSNRKGLDILRGEMKDGTFPLALAPESQVTYHMYKCSDISSGISSLASWGEASTKDVSIIPIAVGYKHSEHREQFIRDMVDRWEEETGIRILGKEHAPVIDLLRELTDRTLSLLEEFYHLECGESFEKRIASICEAGLDTAEKLTGLTPEGSWLDRLFRIRYTGAYALKPEDRDPAALPPLGRSLADLDAVQAHIYLRHSQIIDVLEYLDPSYIYPGCSLGRCCEYALNLLDVLNRMKGGNINTRYTPKNKDAVILIGEPIQLSRLLEDQEMNRKQKLTFITDTTQYLLQQVSEQLEGLWETEYTTAASDDG